MHICRHDHDPSSPHRLLIRTSVPQLAFLSNTHTLRTRLGEPSKKALNTTRFCMMHIDVLRVSKPLCFLVHGLVVSVPATVAFQILLVHAH